MAKPQQRKISARLKTGKSTKANSIKSMTYPLTIRLIKFPSAPEKINTIEKRMALSILESASEKKLCAKIIKVMIVTAARKNF